MNASPPIPVMFGSVTLSTAAMAMAASAAFPPRFKISSPVSEANGWLVATMPRLARTTDRPTGTPENQVLSCAGGPPSPLPIGAVMSNVPAPVTAEAPAEISRNSRRLRVRLMTGRIIVSKSTRSAGLQACAGAGNKQA